MNSLPIGWIIAIALLTWSRIGVAQQQNDPQTGVTIQLPVLGVSVDAAGVLDVKAFPDIDGRLMTARRLAVRQNLNANVQKQSPLRKISLRRLEQTLKSKIEKGEKPDEELKYLAGLQRAEYAFLMPDLHDVIIAGPAEAWVEDPAGRVVGVTTGLPTLLLDDLLVALRTFPDQRSANTWVACSINPTADGIRNLLEFQKQIPQRVPENARDQITPEIARGLRDSLGMTNVEVYGVPRTTHLARVMIEADYRMKLIAVGLEPPPIRMTTFVDALKGAPRDMQAWWLTPEYKCVKQTDDGLSIQLIGRGVALKTENILFGPQAQILQSRLKPSRAARSYASSFTKLYESISQRRPVFAELRNGIDLCVLAAWIARNDGFQKTGWQPDLLFDEGSLPTLQLTEIKHAPSVANAVWKGNMLVLPVGGGVSIQASEALTDDNLIPDDKQEIQPVRANLKIPDDDRWWWD
jgi:hypothetical protein